MGVNMDPVWMHLLVNHIPIIVPVFGLLVVIVGLLLKNPTVKRVGIVVYVVSGLAIYPANMTGESAEDKVEQISGVSKHQVHEHEEAAELMLTLMSVALVLGLLHLFNRPANPMFQRMVLIAFILAATWSAVQGVITGHEGGLIRRPDLGNTQASGVPTESSQQTH